MRGKRAASMKLGFGEPQTWELALAYNCSVPFWFRGRTCAVVDYGITADRSEPKNYQRLLNGEILLDFLSCPCFTPPQDLKVLHTLDHAYRIHDVKFTQRDGGGGEVLLVAAEDKKTTVYEVSPDTEIILRPIAYLVGHGNRCVVECHSGLLLKRSYQGESN